MDRDTQRILLSMSAEELLLWKMIGGSPVRSPQQFKAHAAYNDIIEEATPELKRKDARPIKRKTA